MALKFEASYNKIAQIGEKEIKFKAWTAKEERKYLTTMENEKTKVTDKLIFDILIRPCIENKDIVLSVSEQKLLLIEIRKESIGETFTDSIECTECGEKTEKVILIEDIVSYEVSKYEPIEISLDENKFKFLLDDIKTNKDKERLVFDNGIVTYIFTDFLLHIKSVDINGELNEKFSFKELEQFMDSLPTKVFDEVFSEYQKMVDSLDLTYEFTCPKCNTTEKLDYTNIPNFLWL
jgi:hypothetical protein